MTNSYIKPAIILVRPQLGENIGACARVMCNFSLSDLRIISPRDGWPNQFAIDMAKSGKHILENAKIFNNLEEALSDIYYLYATTIRPRDMIKPIYSPRKAIAQIYANTHHKSAIVFGPERTGLTNQEIALANSIISIPVSPDYESLNLAQATAILCYEYFNFLTHYPDQQIELGDTKPASLNEITMLFSHLEGELSKTDFLKIPEKREKMLVNIKNLFTRSWLSQQDVRTLRGIIKALVKNPSNIVK